MSGRATVVPTIFTIIDQFSPPIDKMGKKVDTFTNHLNSVAGSSNRLFNSLTPSLSAASKQFLSFASSASIAMGVLATARFSADAIMDYETALQSLQAVTGVSNDEMADFKAEIGSLAKESKKSSIDIASSFETIGSMMSQYLEDPKGLRQIADAGVVLSKAAKMELEPALMSLTSVMNQFNLKAEDARGTVERLTAGEIVGSVRTAEAADYLKEFGAQASNMNVSVTESVALIEALGIQMDKTKIGVGARNLLTIISSAGGLDKKARQDLQAAGVSTKFLMDNTKSLSDRLHHLSKIAKDPIKMVSVFGKENLTAANVIFSQLATYDKFVNTIERTEKAEMQAALNSNTLAQSFERLKSGWVNMLVNSEKVNAGLDYMKDGLNFVGDNMSDLVDNGITLLKFMAGWKLLNIAMNGLVAVNSIRLGINNALMLQNTAALGTNAIAMRASIITEKAMAMALAVSTGNWAALNTVIAANPLGIALLAVGALILAFEGLASIQESLVEKYKENLKIDQSAHLKKESEAVRSLAWQYWHLGQNMNEATVSAIRFERGRIGMERAKLEQYIGTLKGQLAAENQKIYAIDLIAGGEGVQDLLGSGVAEVGKRKELATQLLAAQERARALADENLGVTQYARTEMDKGTFSQSDLGTTFNTPKKSYGNSQWGKAFEAQDEAADFRFYRNAGSPDKDSKATAVVTIKNDSSAPVDVKTGSSATKNVMPTMTSTLTMNGK